MTEDIFERKYNELLWAVRDIYYAAYWYPDREVDAMKMWTRLRDAAGFPPGQTKETLGKPCRPVWDKMDQLLAGER